MTTWHRIDDPEHPAPKDGTEILVYFPKSKAYDLLTWCRDREVGMI